MVRSYGAVIRVTFFLHGPVEDNMASRRHCWLLDLCPFMPGWGRGPGSCSLVSAAPLQCWTQPSDLLWVGAWGLFASGATG